jgi:hypothetical protein
MARTDAWWDDPAAFDRYEAIADAATPVLSPERNWFRN